MQEPIENFTSETGAPPEAPLRQIEKSPETKLAEVLERIKSRVESEISPLTIAALNPFATELELAQFSLETKEGEGLKIGIYYAGTGEQFGCELIAKFLKRYFPRITLDIIRIPEKYQKIEVKKTDHDIIVLPTDFQELARYQKINLLLEGRGYISQMDNFREETDNPLADNNTVVPPLIELKTINIFHVTPEERSQLKEVLFEILESKNLLQGPPDLPIIIGGSNSAIRAEFFHNHRITPDRLIQNAFRLIEINSNELTVKIWDTKEQKFIIETRETLPAFNGLLRILYAIGDYASCSGTSNKIEPIFAGTTAVIDGTRNYNHPLEDIDFNGESSNDPIDKELFKMGYLLPIPELIAADAITHRPQVSLTDPELKQIRQAVVTYATERGIPTLAASMQKLFKLIKARSCPTSTGTV